MRSRSYQWIVPLLLLLSTHTHAADLQRTLAGVYVFDQSRSDNVTAVVEAGALTANFLFRKVYTEELKKSNYAYQQIKIEYTASLVRVTFDDKRSIATPLNADSFKWTREDGRPFDVKIESTSTHLLQTFLTSGGQRVSEYTLSSDGGSLTLRVTNTSPISRPITYSLVYIRKQAS